jgi:hypothetical protein
MEKTIYQTLSGIDLKDSIDLKGNLKYLGWSSCFRELSRIYPDWTFQVREFGDGKQYYEDDSGAVVHTSITINGITKSCWLPVMDDRNNAKKNVNYTYETSAGKIFTVPAYDMRDINDTIMRCLVKNAAFFGLGLYLYEKEGKPEIDIEELAKQKLIGLKQYLAKPDAKKEKALSVWGEYCDEFGFRFSVVKEGLDLIAEKFKAEYKK